MEKPIILTLSGLANGSVYGLIGLGLALIYTSSRVINFAQGEFVMIGAMLIATLMLTLELPPLVACLLVCVACATIALLLERLTYAPLVRRAELLYVLIGTFAGALIISGAALVIWGPSQIYVPNVFPNEPIRLGAITTTGQQLAIIVSFIAALLTAWVILYKTGFGLQVRATGINPVVAELMGIRTSRVLRFAFVFSAILSGVSGLLIGPFLGGQVAMGVPLTVKGFMAAILGGLGNPFAAAAGGLAIGLLESFVGGYGNSLYAEPIIFSAILVVLIVRPYGLLGEFEAAQR